MTTRRALTCTTVTTMIGCSRVRRRMTTRRTLTHLYNGDGNDVMLLGVRRRMTTRRALTHLYNGDNNDRMLLGVRRRMTTRRACYHSPVQR